MITLLALAGSNPAPRATQHQREDRQMRLGGFEKSVLSVIALLFLILVTYGTALAVTEKQCAERGYPESKVTWDLQGYCINIDGVVKGVVVPSGQ